MDLLRIFYKNDEFTNELRLSKVNIFTFLVFVICFIYIVLRYVIFNSYGYSLLDNMLVAIPFGLVFAIPTFIIGKLIGMLFNKVNPNLNSKYKVVLTNDYSQRFKNAIDNNMSEEAKIVLENWGNDANYYYGKIIFEGVPPTDKTYIELNNWLKKADTLKTENLELREWYRKTAIQVMERWGMY